MPEDHGGFYPQYGFLISVLDENSWKVILSNDKVTLSFFIKHINETGIYQIYQSDGDRFFSNAENSGIEFTNKVSNETFRSVDESGTIEVLSYETDEKLMFQFDKIVLESTSNESKTIVLTDGKLNVNKATLNRD